MLIVLPATFYDREPTTVAQELLGKVLIRASAEGKTSGIIVETEAYLAENDPANHAFIGRTERNKAMFGAAGHAYVYRLHQVYCLNAVTEPEGVPSAVLIRAVEPLEGVELMQRRRRQKDLVSLTSGPGRLCQAFGIDLRFDGWDLTRGEELWIAESDNRRSFEVVVTKRVGVSAARDFPLRYCVKGSPFISNGLNLSLQVTSSSE